MSLAEELARKVWDDICDRRGLKWEAQQVDDDVRDREIIPRWAEYFNEALERAAEEADKEQIYLSKMVRTPVTTTSLTPEQLEANRKEQAEYKEKRGFEKPGEPKL